MQNNRLENFCSLEKQRSIEISSSLIVRLRKKWLCSYKPTDKMTFLFDKKCITHFTLTKATFRRHYFLLFHFFQLLFSICLCFSLFLFLIYPSFSNCSSWSVIFSSPHYLSLLLRLINPLALVSWRNINMELQCSHPLVGYFFIHIPFAFPLSSFSFYHGFPFYSSTVFIFFFSVIPWSFCYSAFAFQSAMPSSSIPFHYYSSFIH